MTCAALQQSMLWGLEHARCCCLVFAQDAAELSCKVLGVLQIADMVVFATYQCSAKGLARVLKDADQKQS